MACPWTRGSSPTRRAPLCLRCAARARRHTRQCAGDSLAPPLLRSAGADWAAWRFAYLTPSEKSEREAPDAKSREFLPSF